MSAPTPDGASPATPSSALTETESSPTEPPYRTATLRAAWPDIRITAWFVVVAAIGYLLAGWAKAATEGFDDTVRREIAGIPSTAIHVSLLTLEIAAGATLVAVIITLAVRRTWGVLVRGIIGAILGGGVFLGLSHLGVLRATAVTTTSFAAGLSPNQSSLLVACAAGIVATLRPMLKRGLLWMLWIVVIVLAILRTLGAPDAPLDVVFAIGVGGAFGTAVLLVGGRSVHVLTPAGVRQALEKVDVTLTEVVEADPHSTWAFEASTDDGRELVIRVVDEREWQRDNRAMALRRIRLRDPADDSGHASPARIIESEALATMLAAERGVRVPQVQALAVARGGQALLAADHLPGRALDSLTPEELTDGVLALAWEQATQLRRARLVHRELTLHHMVLDDAGQVWVTNLANAEPAATDAALDADAAELLASCFAAVGAQRAVAPALAALGQERLMAAVERLVAVALTSGTRAALKAKKLKLDDLIAAASESTGKERPKLIKVERFKVRTLVMAACLCVAVYILAPQFAQWPKMVQALDSADWSWIPLVLLASVATYIGSGLGLNGGTPGRVPVFQASSVAVAGSFVATFTFAGVSTIGLNTRYLQQRGFPLPVAISSSAAKEAAVGVVHVILLIVFALWAGSTGALTKELHELPPLHVILIVVVAVLAVVGIAFAVPKVRSLLRAQVMPAVKQTMEAMEPVVTHPMKLVSLFSGVAMIPLGFGVCLWASVRSFYPEANFATVVLVSLTAGVVASAVPVPGGVGAYEAVLTAALTAIGYPAAPALTGVLLYRIATFWLPIPPGIVAFRVLTNRKLI